MMAYYIYIYIYKLQAYNGYFDCHFLIVNIFFWGSNGLENLWRIQQYMKKVYMQLTQAQKVK